jgi:hypothetical protein
VSSQKQEHSSQQHDFTPYSALAKGRFYLFFIRLVEIFVTVLCGVDRINPSVR